MVLIVASGPGTGRPRQQALVIGCRQGGDQVVLLGVMEAGHKVAAFCLASPFSNGIGLRESRIIQVTRILLLAGPERFISSVAYK